MIPKEFDAIAKEDIEVLVANAVSEGRTIEYKEQLPGGTDEDKREFLADVSSFANAAGGDLIYGVREKRDAGGKPLGIPEAAEGLAGVNADAEKRRPIAAGTKSKGYPSPPPGKRIRRGNGRGPRGGADALDSRVPADGSATLLRSAVQLRRIFGFERNRQATVV